MPSLSAPIAAALIAVIAYVIGRKRRQKEQPVARRELKRARFVVYELENIATDVRRQIAFHHEAVQRFRKRLRTIESKGSDDTGRDLAEEAERLLKPTMTLSTQIARAYEEVRQQATLLMSFTEVRTDPLTGVSNRRALQDTLAKLLALKQRYGSNFTIALFDIDHFKEINDENGHLYGDAVLQDVARVFDDTARETDIVTRYGGEEFVIVMPETNLEGACIFAERVRAKVEETLHLTISGGVAYAEPKDTEASLVSRADEAMYEAKAQGRNWVYSHDGDAVVRVEREVLPHDPNGTELTAPPTDAAETL